MVNVKGVLELKNHFVGIIVKDQFRQETSVDAKSKGKFWLRYLQDLKMFLYIGYSFQGENI